MGFNLAASTPFSIMGQSGTFGEFVAAIATQQQKADTEHSESWKVNGFKYSGYSLSNTGFNQSNTGLSIRTTGGDISVTGISGLAGGLKLSYFPVENFTRAWKQTEILADKLVAIVEIHDGALTVRH